MVSHRLQRPEDNPMMRICQTTLLLDKTRHANTVNYRVPPSRGAHPPLPIYISYSVPATRYRYMKHEYIVQVCSRRQHHTCLYVPRLFVHSGSAASIPMSTWAPSMWEWLKKQVILCFSRKSSARSSPYPIDLSIG